MTMRANPATSWDSACRHLFRHVDEAGELRRNPIVSRFFPNGPVDHADKRAVEAVRTAIVAALEEYELDAFSRGRIEESRRRRAIVALNILEHRSADTVAAELHLSRRQFYNERRAICERIARALGAEQQHAPSSPGFVALRPDVIAIAHARQLLEGCEPQRAFGVLDDVAHRASDPMRQVEARCLMGSLLTAQLQYDQAKCQIDIARRLLSGQVSDISESLIEPSQARIDLALALLASSNGRSSETKQLIRKVLSALRRTSSDDQEHREFHVDALLFASEQASTSGEFKAFRHHLAAAQSVLSTIRNQSLRQKARLLWLAGTFSNLNDSRATFSDSSLMQIAARSIAENAGLILTAIDAALRLAYDYAFGLGDYDAALRQALPAVDIALRTRNPALIGSVCLDAAAIRRASRQFGESLKLLEIVRRHGKVNAHGNVLLHLELSAIYLALRDYHRTRTFAEKACDLAASTKNRRLRASALRMSAIAHFRDHETAIARERIMESLELVERFGNRHSTAGTYFASSIITGNREHARLANGLNPRAVSLYAIA